MRFRSFALLRPAAAGLGGRAGCLRDSSGQVFLRPLYPLCTKTIKGWHTPFIIFGVVFGVASGFLIYVLWPLLTRTLNLRMTLSTLGLQGLAWSAFVVYYFAANP